MYAIVSHASDDRRSETYDLLPISELGKHEVVIAFTSVGGRLYAINGAESKLLQMLRDGIELSMEDLEANRGFVLTPFGVANELNRVSLTDSDILELAAEKMADPIEIFGYEELKAKVAQHSYECAASEYLVYPELETFENIFDLYFTLFPAYSQLAHHLNLTTDGHCIMQTTTTWRRSHSAQSINEMAELVFGDSNRDRVRVLAELPKSMDFANSLTILEYSRISFGVDLTMRLVSEYGPRKITSNEVFDFFYMDSLTAEDFQVLLMLPQSARTLLARALIHDGLNATLVPLLCSALRRRTKFKSSIYRSAKTVGDIFRFALRYAEPRDMPEGFIPPQLLALDGVHTEHGIVHIMKNESEMAEYARVFKNCLLESDYYTETLVGRKFVFVLMAEDGSPIASVSLRLSERSGWVVSELRGRDNEELENQKELRKFVKAMLSDEIETANSVELLSSQDRMPKWATAAELVELHLQDAVVYDRVANIEELEARVGPRAVFNMDDLREEPILENEAY